MVQREVACEVLVRQLRLDNDGPTTQANTSSSTSSMCPGDRCINEDEFYRLAQLVLAGVAALPVPPRSSSSTMAISRPRAPYIWPNQGHNRFL
jgi:hypothetical protein